MIHAGTTNVQKVPNCTIFVLHVKYITEYKMLKAPVASYLVLGEGMVYNIFKREGERSRTFRRTLTIEHC